MEGTLYEAANNSSAAWAQSTIGHSVEFGSLFGSFPTGVRILLLSLTALVFFGLMGVAAFDYMSPNLTYIARESGLSQSVMGVTVMAFGNGSVDVFSAIIATQQGDGSMAIGEIMGGAFFVVSVVLGSMALVNPFKLDKELFLRDALVLTLSVATVLAIAYDGVITLPEALAALAIYGLYAVLVVRSHFRSEEDAGLPVHEGALTEVSDVDFVPIQPSIFRAIDLNWRVNHPGVAGSFRASEEFYDANRRRNSAHPVPTGIPPPPPTPAVMASPTDSQTTLHIPASHGGRSYMSLPPLLGRHHSVDSTASVRSHESHMLTIEDLVASALSESFDECAFSHLAGHDEDSNHIDYRNMSVRDTLFWICIPGHHKFSESSWLLRLKNIAIAPALFPLSASTPIISFSKSRLCLGMYSVAIPLVLPMLVDPIPFNAITAGVQVLASTALLYWYVYKNHIPAPPLVAACGFVMSLFWVVFLATELVKVLVVLAELCHISESFMGLTIFALGDSLGDFISNLTVARIGFSTMAIAACFGGPIFTLLVGISASSLIAMATNHSLVLRVHMPLNIVISGCGVIFTLWMLAAMLHYNDWVLSKKMGAAMITVWAGVLAVCVRFFSK